MNKLLCFDVLILEDYIFVNFREGSWISSDTWNYSHFCLLGLVCWLINESFNSVSKSRQTMLLLRKNISCSVDFPLLVVIVDIVQCNELINSKVNYIVYLGTNNSLFFMTFFNTLILWHFSCFTVVSDFVICFCFIVLDLFISFLCMSVLTEDMYV